MSAQGQNNNYNLGSNLSLEMVKNNIFECCTNQMCARFIQDKLGQQNLPNHERLNFLNALLLDNSFDFEKLMVDCFGNYILQRVLQMPRLEHKYLDAVFKHIKGKIYLLSTNKHGCRVIQVCLSVFTLQKKTAIVKELIENYYIKDCSFDFNGNHVIQKII